MCNCVVEVTAKVATHLESQGVEIVGTPVMDAALRLDSMQLTTSTKIHYVQKVVNKRRKVCEEVGGHDTPILPVLW